MNYVNATDIALDQANIESLNAYPFSTWGYPPTFSEQPYNQAVAPRFRFGQDRNLSMNTNQWYLYLYPYIVPSNGVDIIPQAIIIDGVATVSELTPTSPEIDIFIEPDYHQMLVW